MRSLIAIPVLAAFWGLLACGGNDSVAAPSSTARTPSITVVGTVRDTSDTPLAGVSVRSGLIEVTTDPSGVFSIPMVQGQVLLRVDKEGYESRNAGFNVGPTMATLSIFMQRQYVLGEADKLPLTLMPHDNPYYVGEHYESDYCAPCQLIRLRATAGLGVNVRLQWAASANVAMWESYGNKCAADGPSGCTVHVTGTTGDIILYVGLTRENGRPQALAQPLALELMSSPRQAH
jgi:hypothetical protein